MDVTHIRSRLDLVVGTCGDVDWSLPTQKGGGEGRAGEERGGERKMRKEGEGRGKGGGGGEGKQHSALQRNLCGWVCG